MLPLINFHKGKCPKCGRVTELMFSNNPLNNADNSTICFSCINDNIDPKNLNQADFFCRTYNLPFDPEVWMEFTKTYDEEEIFRQYTSTVLENSEDHINLYYSTSTKDLWTKVNKEWEKSQSFTDILAKLSTVRESYMERSRMKWGQQYEFGQLIKLDTIYSRTLRSNRITNPMQKAAIQTLCKIQLEMDEAIQMKDAKAIKDFSSAWSTFAKQADLENMINETKTDDITTIAELYDYMERQQYKFKFFQGELKDEIDVAINDIQEANRKLILEATGLQTTLEEMIEQRMRSQEQAYTQEVTAQEGATLEDLLNFTPEDAPIDTEDDSAATEMDFSEEENNTDDFTSNTIVVPKQGLGDIN